MIREDILQRFLYINGCSNFTDKIVHTFTIWILIFFTLLLSSHLLFGELIVCQIGAEIPETWVQYFHSYCFNHDKFTAQYSTVIVNRTIRISGENSRRLIFQDHVKKSVENEHKISYYQWIPYILLLQIIISLIPSFFWNNVGLRYFFGADIKTILKPFREYQDEAEKSKNNADALQNPEILNNLAYDFHRLLKLKKNDKFGAHSSMILYVSSKWLSVFSFLFQFWMIAKFFAYGQLFWGFYMIDDILSGKSQTELDKGYFPRLVKCNVSKIEMATIHQHTLNCLLSQNFINEKVYLFIYWWLLFVIIVAFLSASWFTLILAFPAYRRYTTMSLLPTKEFFLQIREHSSLSLSVSQDPFEYFVNYLGCDGYLLLKLICDTDTIVGVRRLSRQLWLRVIIDNDGDSNNPSAPPLSDEFDNNGGDGDFRRLNCGKKSHRVNSFKEEKFEPSLFQQT